jgi:calmodulin-binding transcription activator
LFLSDGTPYKIFCSYFKSSLFREKTVVALIALGAAPGLLTDPTPKFPSGRTPADLASSNNHKGISGFLAESSLTSLLEILTLKDSKSADLARIHTVLTGPSDVNIPTDDGSLKDSLSAVRNSAQAVARIYQVYRMQSFQRKQLEEFDDDNLGISDERALAIASAKAIKKSPGDMQNLAATRIQNKFRGWKGRKEFLLIKQRIVKIQVILHYEINCSECGSGGIRTVQVPPFLLMCSFLLFLEM